MIEDAAQRLRRRDEQLKALVPRWSMARVVGQPSDARSLVPGRIDPRGDRGAPNVKYFIIQALTDSATKLTKPL